MRKSLLPLGIAAVLTPTILLAQQTPQGSADYTSNVRSESLGRGSTSDVTTQYLQQRALNNLPGQQLDKAARDRLGTSRPAKPNELTAGAVVNDRTGTAIATIAQVSPDGVVVSSGAAKVKIPAEAFGRNKAGLLLDTTKADFEKIVAKALAGS